MPQMKMWKWIYPFIVAVALTIAANAQQKCQCSDCKSDPSCSCCPGQVLRGTIKSEGQKITFTNDQDNKKWVVANPEALKGKEGHHVEVTGHVSAEKRSITVTGVKMMKNDSAMKDDSK